MPNDLSCSDPAGSFFQGNPITYCPLSTTWIIRSPFFCRWSLSSLDTCNPKMWFRPFHSRRNFLSLYFSLISVGAAFHLSTRLSGSPWWRRADYRWSLRLRGGWFVSRLQDFIASNAEHALAVPVHHRSEFCVFLIICWCVLVLWRLVFQIFPTKLSMPWRTCSRRIRDRLQPDLRDLLNTFFNCTVEMFHSYIIPKMRLVVDM